ncbi:MAG: CoA transferase [Chloroflexi bacterium]|nr:CoA transferase [Chloroflexota bacterium]
MPALDDIRILDLSRVLAGPYCTMTLADFGAEVIKIEEPNLGDGTRQWGPPWVGDQSAYFLSANRNKKSVTLNLKHPRGVAILHQLLATADILIENFKVGTMAKMGLDYETLAPRYPHLIYCAITGYGHTGPYKDLPGYDFMIQAQGGIMSITGEADGEPMKVGVAIADVTTGLFASQAILAALHHRTRTGRGQFIDVSLLDTQVAWLINVAHNYLATAEAPQRYGNAHPNIVPYQSFPTADGHLALAVGTDGQFGRLCQLIGRPELGEDGRYQRNAGRVAHRAELVGELTAVFRTRPTAEWLALLAEANIPAGPINDIPTILRDPHVQARGMVQTITHPSAGEIELLGPVAKLSETPPTIQSAPPTLGQHTAEILANLGYDEEQVAELRQEGVV